MEQQHYHFVSKEIKPLREWVGWPSSVFSGSREVLEVKTSFPWVYQLHWKIHCQTDLAVLFQWLHLWQQLMTREILMFFASHYFANIGLSRQTSPSTGFSSSHVWMWELDHKESRAPKNWCFWTVVLGKTLESPLDCKIQLVNPKGVTSEYSLEGLMLKLNLEYSDQLMQRTDSLEKSWCWERLKAGGEGDDRG